jgi:hypothetical protein
VTAQIGELGNEFPIQILTGYLFIDIHGVLWRTIAISPGQTPRLGKESRAGV